MAIIINDNLAVNAGKPVDNKYLNISTPWTSVSQVNTNIPESYRYLGLTVNINSTEYWYKNSVTDGGLVLKNLVGTLNNVINGLSLVSSGTTVSLGGTLTGNTVFDGGASLYNLRYGGNYHTNYTNRTLVDKQYVDTYALGLTPIQSVLVATTGNTTLSGLTTIDGILLTGGDRILVKDQTSGANNGVYSASTGVWGRTNDFNLSAVTGTYMWVLSGDTLARTAWVLTTKIPTIGVTPLVFVLFTQVLDVSAGVGIDITTLAGNYEINFDGANVAGNSICWDGSQLGINPSTQLVIDGSITGATNGLTKTGRNVVLGGDLTGNTMITLPYASKTSLIIGQDTTNWYGGRLEICRDNTSVSGNSALFGVRYDATCYSTIQALATSGICFGACVCGGQHSMKLGSNALTYSSCYHGDYVNRSLVDKEYVDNSTSAISASNGLTRIGDYITLGGTLTGNTGIGGGGNDLELGMADNELSNLYVKSVGLTEIVTSNLDIYSCSATYYDGAPFPSGITYGACYHNTYVNRSLVDKEYVDNKVIMNSGNTIFNSDIVVSIAAGKTFGRYINGDTIPASGKTANQVMLLALVEPLTPTINLTSSSNIVTFGLAHKIVNLDYSYVINSLNASVASVSLEWRRNNTGAWTTLSTNTGSTAYMHNINDSVDRFLATVINYRYIVIDSLGASGQTTHDVVPEAYALPTFSPTYVGTVLSYETQMLREIGNVNTTIDGGIASNRSLVKLTAYRVQRSVNGGSWTTITSESSFSALTKTITSYLDSGAVGGATSIEYRVQVDDDYTTNTSPTYSIVLKYASYYGYSVNASLTGSQIHGLGNQALLSSRSRTMTLTAPATYYTYVSYPASFGDLVSAVMDGASTVLGAFTKLSNVTVTNGYGQLVSNIVYKSNSTLAFTNNSVAFS